MDEKGIDWRGSSYKDMCDMPEEVRKTFGYALGLAQNNLRYEDAKALPESSRHLLKFSKTTTAIPIAPFTPRTTPTWSMYCTASR
jgi:phage-related protein